MLVTVAPARSAIQCCPAGGIALSSGDQGPAREGLPGRIGGRSTPERAEGQEGVVAPVHQPALGRVDVGGEDLREIALADVEVAVLALGGGRVGEGSQDGGLGTEQPAREGLRGQHAGDRLTLVEDVGRGEDQGLDVGRTASGLPDHRAAVRVTDQDDRPLDGGQDRVAPGQRPRSGRGAGWGRRSRDGPGRRGRPGWPTSRWSRRSAVDEDDRGRVLMPSTLEAARCPVFRQMTYFDVLSRRCRRRPSAAVPSCRSGRSRSAWPGVRPCGRGTGSSRELGGQGRGATVGRQAHGVVAAVQARRCSAACWSGSRAPCPSARARARRRPDRRCPRR